MDILPDNDLSFTTLKINMMPGFNHGNDELVLYKLYKIRPTSHQLQTARI